MKLELKHLAGYLPYGLKMYWEDNQYRPQVAWELKPESVDFVLYNQNKPILRPLSDLTNEDTIEFYGLGSIELELIDINEWTEELIQEIKTGQKFQLSQFEYLFSKHFDIYNLIENNLAIDKNTIL